MPKDDAICNEALLTCAQTVETNDQWAIREYLSGENRVCKIITDKHNPVISGQYVPLSRCAVGSTQQLNIRDFLAKNEVRMVYRHHEREWHAYRIGDRLTVMHKNINACAVLAAVAVKECEK